MPNFDPSKTVQQIYPILVFRDKVVRSISAIINKIPGLEALVDKVTETLTLFVLSLLAPFIRPIINGLTQQLQAGSSAVVDSSGKHQYEPWTDPNCTDPTHSMLSKDHFSNILNEPAGLLASEILKFVAPRVLYAWDHPNVPVQQVLDDCMKVFHHPAARDQHTEVQRNMFDSVQRWAHSRPRGSHDLNDILSSESVRAGRNHKEKPGQAGGGHSHGAPPPQQHSIAGMSSGFPGQGGGWGGSGSSSSTTTTQQTHHGQAQQQHQSGGGGSFNPLSQLSHVPGLSGVSSTLNKFSNFVPGGLGNFGGSSGGGHGGGGGGGGRRGLDEDDAGPGYNSRGLQPEMANVEGNIGGGAGERGVSPGPPGGYEAYGGGQEGGGGLGYGEEYRPEVGYLGYGGHQDGQQQQGGGGGGYGQQDQGQYQYSGETASGQYPAAGPYHGR